jgi:uncharacterized membrane protein YeaQ/YmgE (transglycosylase-associated protein family)
MVNFIVWLILGGIIGWLASIVMRTDAQQGIFLNIVVGIVGSFIGGIFMRSFGKINDNDFSLSAILAAFVGALVLLAIVNLVRRGRVR